MEFAMRPVGVIHSPFTDRSQTPTQSWRSQAVGQVEVYPEFVKGLKDVEEFSHLYLLFAFHRSTGYSLRVIPYRDTQLRGLFATRSPNRPNPIGLSLVRLLSRDNNVLHIEGVDVLDGTPLLDIKPFIPDFDLVTDFRRGWSEVWSER